MGRRAVSLPQGDRAGFRVLLHRSDGLVDVTNRVQSASIDTGDVSMIGTGALGSDAVVSTATFTFDMESTTQKPALTPRAISPLNNPRPLLRPYRRITVQASEPGQQVEDLFSGYLGDSIQVGASANTRRITVTARDIAKPFQDSFRREFPVLGGPGATIPSVLQQLINLVPVALRPDLVVPEEPNLLLSDAYQPSDTTVWDAMQQLAARMGWYLGARGSELHLLNPPRGNDVPDLYLPSSKVFEDNTVTSDTDLRNRITVEYSPNGESITLSDADSIANVTDGVVKHSFIRYADDSPIRTLTAATEVANAFLHDMSRPHVVTRLNLPFTPSIRVFTMLGVRNAAVSADTRLVAVTSVRHQFDSAGKARTTILGAERVLGAHNNWLAQENKAGQVLALEVTT